MTSKYKRDNLAGTSNSIFSIKLKFNLNGLMNLPFQNRHNVSSKNVNEVASENTK